MYYPYLRGKQFELIVLRDNADILAKAKIHPIIEPVKSDFSAIFRAAKELNRANTECTLIVNPQAGSMPVGSTDIFSELIEGKLSSFDNVSIGYIAHPKSELSELVGFLKKYRDKLFTVIHYGYTNGKELSLATDNFLNIKRHVFIEGYVGKLYQKFFKKDGVNRILIRDGFKAEKKNANYQEKEHFSDLHLTYNTEENMDGFGDFSIVGDNYSETGGPAYAVAIHLTYLDSIADNDMFINHFVSDQTDSPTDPGGKFLEALEKLVKEVEKSKSMIFKSNACKEYLDLYKKKYYPGLGCVKKLSMQHHIELMADFLIKA